jgi:hypothetical protein
LIDCSGTPLPFAGRSPLNLMPLKHLWSMVGAPKDPQALCSILITDREAETSTFADFGDHLL